MTTLSATWASTFMQDYQGGAPISHTGPVAAAASDAAAILFGVDDSGHIRCVTPDPGSPTGWTSVDLQAGLPASVAVQLLAATRRPDGSPVLVTVVRDGAGADHVYETADLSAATSDRWTDRGSQAGLELVDVTAGVNAAGQTIIVLTGKSGATTTAYLVNPDPADTTWNWKPVPSPVDSTAVLHTAVGHNHKLQTITGVEALVYSLQQLEGGEAALVLTSLPDFTVFNHLVPLSPGPAAFGVVTGATGDSVLVVATPSGAGAQLAAADPMSGALTPIGSPTAAPVIRIDLTAGPGGSVDVWAQTADDTLLHASNVSGGWGDLLPFAVQNGTAVVWQDPVTGVVDVFAVALGDEITWFQQDAVTTRWKPNAIRLADTGAVTEVMAYRTHVQVTDETGAAAGGATVSVGCGERSLLTINGAAYDVRPGAPVSVVADALGGIDIGQVVTGLAVPSLTLSGSGLQTSLDPAADVKTQIHDLSAADIADAQMATLSYAQTEPMLPGVSADSLTSAQQVIQRLAAAAAGLPAAGSAPRAPGGAAPASWAADLSGVTPVMVSDPAQVTALARTHAGFGDSVEQVFGDIWHAITSGFERMLSFVVTAVADGLRVIINGLERAWTVVVRYAEQAWDVIEAVFQAIGAGIAKLLRWLGFIFRWTDILSTHTVLRTAASHGFDLLSAKIADGHAVIASAFDTAKQWVLDPGLKTSAAQLPSAGVATTAGAHSSSAATTRPECTWAVRRFANGSTLASGNGVAGAGGSLGTAIDGGLSPVQTTLSGVGTAVVTNGHSLSAQQAAGDALDIVAEALLDAIEQAALGAVDVASEAIGSLGELLQDRWDIPVLTALYETIIAPGSKLSLLDLSCLVAAIPSTIAYKLALETAPFTTQQAASVAATGDFDTMIGVLTAQPVESALTTAASPVPFGARGTSYAFGFLGGISAYVYGITNGLAVAADEEPGFARTACSIKLASGLIAAASSTVTMSITLHYAEEDLPRLRYEMFVCAYQWSFCAKDGLAWWASGIEDEILNTNALLSLLETALGVLNLLFFVALTIAEGVEDDLNSSNVLKIFQNYSGALCQIASFPAAVLEDPVDKGIAAALIAGVGVLPGEVGLVRTFLDIYNNEIYRTP